MLKEKQEEKRQWQVLPVKIKTGVVYYTWKYVFHRQEDSLLRNIQVFRLTG